MDDVMDLSYRFYRAKSFKLLSRSTRCCGWGIMLALWNQDGRVTWLSCAEIRPNGIWIGAKGVQKPAKLGARARARARAELMCSRKLGPMTNRLRKLAGSHWAHPEGVCVLGGGGRRSSPLFWREKKEYFFSFL